MPVVQVAGMEQPSALQVYQEGDTHIGRTEGLDTDMFVFVGVALIDVGGIFRCGGASGCLWRICSGCRAAVFSMKELRD